MQFKSARARASLSKLKGFAWSYWIQNYLFSEFTNFFININISPSLVQKWSNLPKLSRAKIRNLVSPAWVKNRRQSSTFFRKEMMDIFQNYLKLSIPPSKQSARKKGNKFLSWLNKKSSYTSLARDARVKTWLDERITRCNKAR